MQGGKEVFDPGVGDAIPERLAFAPVGHQSLVAHFRQMLRERGLGKPDRLGQRVHVALAPFDEFAEDHQPPLVGERAQDARHLRRGLLEPVGIEGLGRHGPRPPLYFRYC